MLKGEMPGCGNVVRLRFPSDAVSCFIRFLRVGTMRMKTVSQFDAISGNGVPFGASFGPKGDSDLESLLLLRWRIERPLERESGNGRIVYACGTWE
jgi:hypothetical protein